MSSRNAGTVIFSESENDLLSRKRKIASLYEIRPSPVSTPSEDVDMEHPSQEAILDLLLNLYPEEQSEEVNDVSVSLHDCTDPLQSVDVPVTGFQTGKGNKVSVTPQSMNKANQLLQSVDVPVTGFQTGKGNKVSVTPQSMNKANQLLQSVDVPVTGFQTGKGNKVSVTPQSMNKANQLLQSVDVPVTGFQTGKGNKVSVTPQSMNKANQLLQSVDVPVTGFQTGKGNKVSVTPQSMNKANQLLQSVDVPVTGFQTDLKTPTSTKTPRTSALFASRPLHHPRSRAATPVASGIRKVSKTPQSAPIPRSRKPARTYRTPRSCAKTPKNKIVTKPSTETSQDLVLSRLTAPVDTSLPYISVWAPNGPEPFAAETLRRLGVPEPALWMTSALASTHAFPQGGPEEMHKALLKRGALSSLATLPWVQAQYGWIVWKHASMERSFGPRCAKQWFTYDAVLDALCARYDREMVDGKRPHLRKVFEGDASPARHMVLCVAEDMGFLPSTNDENPKARLCLTDGWYRITAHLDDVLTHLLVAQGHIFVGQKLHIVGAHLVGLSQPVPPLEAPSHVHLLLHANGVRPSRWDTRLGLHPHPMHLSISSLVPNGGPIPSIQVCIERTYPSLFIERSDAGVKVRTASTEAMAQETHRMSMERTYTSLLQSGMSPEEAEAQVHTDAVRSVSEVMDMRVVDAKGNRATLSIWRPSMELKETVREGTSFFIHQVEPSKRQHDAMLSLQSTKFTSWRPAPSIPCIPRSIQSFAQVSLSPKEECDVFGRLLHASIRSPDPSTTHRVHRGHLFVLDASLSLIILSLSTSNLIHHAPQPDTWIYVQNAQYQGWDGHVSAHVTRIVDRSRVSFPRSLDAAPLSPEEAASWMERMESYAMERAKEKVSRIQRDE